MYIGFVTSANLITYLTYVEDFVMVLRATQNGPCPDVGIFGLPDWIERHVLRLMV